VTATRKRPTRAELDADLDRYVEESEQDWQRARELVYRDPKLPLISAYVMARDLRSAERALNWLREGKYDFGTAEVFTGSYGRMDLRVRARDEGLITDERAFEGLAHAWSAADPDDTDPRFLALWTDAWRANKRRTLRDKPTSRLPSGAYLKVYRGQDPTDTVERGAFGIAWSLDEKVAMKFANGAATRQHHRGGVVYVAAVWRKDIMGYMVGRGESEVIVDPRDLVYIREV
jgi:hypothetical protein